MGRDVTLLLDSKMAAAVAVIVLLSLSFSARPGCAQDTNAMLSKVVEAIEKLINFYKASFQNMNLDGIYGLKVIEGQIQKILDEHGQGRYADLDPQVVKRLTAVLEDSKWIGESAIAAVHADDETYFQNLAFVISQPWKHFKPHRRIVPALRWEIPVYQSNVDSKLDEAESDKCMMEINQGKKTKSQDSSQSHCALSDECGLVMTKRGLTDYGILHQLLWTALAEKAGCGVELNSLLRRLGFKSTDEMQEEFCTNNYYEMLAVVHVFMMGKVKGAYQDMFMEQQFICPSLGFFEFLKKNYLDQILSWQLPSGCFGDDSEDDLALEDLPQQRVPPKMDLSKLDVLDRLKPVPAINHLDLKKQQIKKQLQDLKSNSHILQSLLNQQDSAVDHLGHPAQEQEMNNGRKAVPRRGDNQHGHLPVNQNSNGQLRLQHLRAVDTRNMASAQRGQQALQPGELLNPMPPAVPALAGSQQSNKKHIQNQPPVRGVLGSQPQHQNQPPVLGVLGNNRPSKLQAKSLNGHDGELRKPLGKDHQGGMNHMNRAQGLAPNRPEDSKLGQVHKDNSRQGVAGHGMGGLAAEAGRRKREAAPPRSKPVRSESAFAAPGRVGDERPAALLPGGGQDVRQDHRQLPGQATRRKLLVEKEMPGGCLAHKTGVAGGALVMYLRYLIDPGPLDLFAPHNFFPDGPRGLLGHEESYRKVMNFLSNQMQNNLDDRDRGVHFENVVGFNQQDGEAGDGDDEEEEDEEEEEEEDEDGEYNDGDEMYPDAGDVPGHQQERKVVHFGANDDLHPNDPGDDYSDNRKEDNDEYADENEDDEEEDEGADYIKRVKGDDGAANDKDNAADDTEYTYYDDDDEDEEEETEPGIIKGHKPPPPQETGARVQTHSRRKPHPPVIDSVPNGKADTPPTRAVVLLLTATSILLLVFLYRFIRKRRIHFRYYNRGFFKL